MSAISEFAASENARWDEVNAAVGALSTAISGVADDVTFLKEEIAKLQPNPEDQALLDAIKARAETSAAALTAAKEALVALDAATQRPPTPPA